ncbi:GntR family transcriptional regulator [Sphingomonas azotifigens]|uniref:GntR family transcriptional regulator n=1 Tax=Sphingomonas azotifigens TaxID=330920 RepID=UPI000A02280C|nr:GntR family transcriptional regulator [Sphingomonas azotifigens]
MAKAADTAYRIIRNDILSGALAPGEQIREEELAEACGVSRTPVREALRRLEAERLIRRAAQRSFVAALSNEEVEEAFILRGMLEGHAAARAAERITQEDLEQLFASVAACARLARSADLDVDSFLLHNREFHATVLRAAGSERLSELLAAIVEQPVVMRTARRYSSEQIARSITEHEELAVAFRHRDPEWARSVMTAHVRRAFHTFAETIEK